MAHPTSHRTVRTVQYTAPRHFTHSRAYKPENHRHPIL
jgi:hypothetical protein